jgi:hypothetical protein
MARGWESKSVEQQQEEAAAAQGDRHAPLTSEQLAETKRREGLELSRRRVLQQLQSACNPRHRQILEKALADLDVKLSARKAV